MKFSKFLENQHNRDSLERELVNGDNPDLWQVYADSWLDEPYDQGKSDFARILGQMLSQKPSQKRLITLGAMIDHHQALSSRKSKAELFNKICTYLPFLRDLLPKKNWIQAFFPDLKDNELLVMLADLNPLIDSLENAPAITIGYYVGDNYIALTCNKKFSFTSRLSSTSQQVLIAERQRVANILKTNLFWEVKVNSFLSDDDLDHYFNRGEFEDLTFPPDDWT